MNNIVIKSIQIEQVSKNIIVTYIENGNILYPTIRGLNYNMLGDWEFIDENPEIIPYRDIAWKDKERPVNIIISNNE